MQKVVSNKQEIMVEPKSEKYEAAPVPGHEWPLIGAQNWIFEKGQGEIEPQETDVLESDFIVDNKVLVVRVYTYVKNPKKERNIGWPCTSFYNLDATQSKSKRKRERNGNSKTQ